MQPSQVRKLKYNYFSPWKSSEIISILFQRHWQLFKSWNNISHSQHVADSHGNDVAAANIRLSSSNILLYWKCNYCA